MWRNEIRRRAKENGADCRVEEFGGSGAYGGAPCPVSLTYLNVEAHIEFIGGDDEFRRFLFKRVRGPRSLYAPKLNREMVDLSRLLVKSIGTKGLADGTVRTEMG